MPSPPRCRPAPPEPRPQALLVDADHVLGFDDLGRRVHGVGEMDAHHRHAVAVGARAFAAAMGLVEGAGGAVAPRAAEDQQAGRRRAARRQPLGHRLLEGPHDGVDGALRGLVVAADHRLVDAGIEDRARPRADLERRDSSRHWAGSPGRPPP